MNQIYKQKYLKYKQKYLNLKNLIIKGGDPKRTVLELQNNTAPYQFKSLGNYNFDTDDYSQSNLFRIGTLVNLEEGKFPLEDGDKFDQSGKTHTIGGEVVKIVGYDISCKSSTLNKFGKCEISVIE